MRHTVRSTILALALIPAVSAGAQGSRTIAISEPAPATSPVIPAGTSFRSRLSMAEEAKLTRRVEQADLLTIEGRFAEARTILRAVADEQKAGDSYPAAALRRLANVEFGLGRPMVAAKVLEELAKAASEVGDPTVELQALVDASILYGQEGRTGKQRELRPRLVRLLDSPAIPEETRRSLAAHLDPK